MKCCCKIILVLYLSHFTDVYAVALLGRGYIHKVAQWRDSSGSVQFLTVAILKPFRRLVQPIWRMILHSPPPMNVRVSCLLFVSSCLKQTRSAAECPPSYTALPVDESRTVKS